MGVQQFRVPGATSRVLGKARAAYRAMRDSSFVGHHELECPMCDYHGLFIFAGDPPRRDARCPRCLSLERHRLLKLWFDRSQVRLQGKAVLHFAPEPAVAQIFKSATGVSGSSARYSTADIEPGRADLTLDIEDMHGQQSAAYDLIVCSHVLEHVDDRKALPELYRILKPGGSLIVMIPIVEGWDRTYEDPAVLSPADRTTYFGQHNHVRLYGADVRSRIMAAGFSLHEFTATEPDVSRYGLIRGEKVFVASK